MALSGGPAALPCCTAGWLRWPGLAAQSRALLAAPACSAHNLLGTCHDQCCSERDLSLHSTPLKTPSCHRPDLPTLPGPRSCLAFMFPAHQPVLKSAWFGWKAASSPESPGSLAEEPWSNPNIRSVGVSEVEEGRVGWGDKEYQACEDENKNGWVMDRCVRA